MIIPDKLLKLMNKEDRPKGVAGMTAAEVQAMNDKKSEREIQGDIKNYLKLRGVRFIMSPRFGKPTTIQAGCPDILFVFKGNPYAMEIKAKNGNASDEQLKVMDDMRADGWNANFVYSVEGVKLILDK